MTDPTSATTSPAPASGHPAITFVNFVLSLAHTTAVHLGDVPDLAGEGGKDLVAAQQMIDILALLEAKTRGNLTAEERQLVEQLLYELRLRFVEVSGGAGGVATSAAVRPSDSRIILP
jgi:hypothetical protein